MRFLYLAAILLFSSRVSNAEQWIVRIDFWNVPAYYTMNLAYDDSQITGVIDGEQLSGLSDGKSLSFRTNTNGQPTRFEGLIDNDRMAGTADYPTQTDGIERVESHTFTAWLVPERTTGSPRTHSYSANDYSNTFDADRAPVLTIWPGDSVETKTIDSGGIDELGQTKALFGNPQTGPFFVVGAESGDTLAIHLNKLTLNRDYADSLDTIVRRAVGSSLTEEAKDLGRRIRWKLDHENGVARPENASGALADFSVPLKPMLGGLAVAPGFGWPALSAGDSGRFGGNMDFPEVTQGNTIYLPVQRPGGLLYLGDAHALQGEGETTQYALETSMDVTFTVHLIKGNSIGAPRVESPNEIMVLGQAGTMEDALKAATSGMVTWLREDYGLSLSEAAQVMGVSIRLSIVNLAGRNVGIAAKLDKALLPASRGKLSIATPTR